MKVVLILDVTPASGESRREGEAVREEVESEIDGMTLDIPNASGDVSMHEVKVAGIGADVATATLSFAERKRGAQQAETVGGG